MPEWEHFLDRWRGAELIDSAAEERIRAFEAAQAPVERKAGGLRWPAVIALALGGLMLGAGVLLFVAAHWENLSPGERFAMVIAMVAMFHTAGTFAAMRGWGNFATVMFGLGTASLGAGIFLAGQIFNLQSHWPAGVLLWAAGAWIGYWLLRDWVQLTLAALLTPFWLCGEWTESYLRFDDTHHAFRVLAEGTLLLAITYFAARAKNLDSEARHALTWIGGITFLPGATTLALERELTRSTSAGSSSTREFIGYAVAYVLPLALAWWLRKRDAWMNAVAALWVFLLGLIATTHNVGIYAWCGLGAAGMIAWGIRDGRGERVNIGMVGFAVTLLFFYFSEVMDKLDRSASLVGLGVLFLAGGWGLERMRRRFIAQVREAR